MKKQTRRKRENFDRKREDQAPWQWSREKLIEELEAKGQPLPPKPEPLFHPEWVAYDPSGFARACEQFTKDMKRWEEQGF
jgi:hypothetical protein